MSRDDIFKEVLEAYKRYRYMASINLGMSGKWSREDAEFAEREFKRKWEAHDD